MVSQGQQQGGDNSGLYLVSKSITWAVQGDSCTTYRAKATTDDSLTTCSYLSAVNMAVTFLQVVRQPARQRPQAVLHGYPTAAAAATRRTRAATPAVRTAVMILPMRRVRQVRPHWT